MNLNEAIACLRTDPYHENALSRLQEGVDAIRGRMHRNSRGIPDALMDEVAGQVLMETWQKISTGNLPELHRPGGWLARCFLWRLLSRLEREKPSAKPSALPRAPREHRHERQNPFEAEPALLETLYRSARRRHPEQETMPEAWHLLQQLHEGEKMRSILCNKCLIANSAQFRIERNRLYQALRRLRMALSDAAERSLKGDELDLALGWLGLLLRRQAGATCPEQSDE